jgi:hypothetical protein
LYKKKEAFLQNDKWVDDLCSNGKLGKAIARAKNFGKVGQSYSNVYKAFEKL